MRPWLVLAVALPALGAPVSLSVAPEVPCVSEGSLRARLSAAGFEVRERGVLDLDLSPARDGVRLRARRSRDALLLVRTVSSRRSCDGVEAAVVMLIREWAGGEPLEVPALPFAHDAGVVVTSAPPTVPRPSSAPEPVATPTAKPTESADSTLDAGGLAAPDAGPSPVVPQPDDGGSLASVAVTPRGPGVELRVSTGGGVSSVIGTPVAPAGAFAVDVGLGPWGGAASLALDGDVTVQSADASATFSTQSLSVFARHRMSSGRWSLDVAVGARVQRLFASGLAAGRTTTLSLFGGGPIAAATAWLKLIGPLCATVHASAALRLPAERLVIVNGPTFTIGLLQLSVIAGLGVAWP